MTLQFIIIIMNRFQLNSLLLWFFFDVMFSFTTFIFQSNKTYHKSKHRFSSNISQHFVFTTLTWQKTGINQPTFFWNIFTELFQDLSQMQEAWLAEGISYFTSALFLLFWHIVCHYCVENDLASLDAGPPKI